MKKEIKDFIFAVDILTDNLEFMIEDGDVDCDKLLKRIEIVNKFKDKLNDKL